jgi:hypothetical protein
LRFKLTVISILMVFFIAHFLFHRAQASETNGILYIDYAEKGNNQVVSRINLTSKVERVLLRKKLDTYPCSAFIKDRSIIFYTARTNNNTVQLFEKNFITNKTKQITKNFNYIGALKYNKKKHLIYLSALIGKTVISNPIVTYYCKTNILEYFSRKISIS